MADLYTGEELTRLRRTLHRVILFCVLPVTVALVISVVLCFFVSDTNATRLRNINIALSSVGGCVSLYLLLNAVLPRARRVSVVRQLAEGQPLTLYGTVTGIGEETTLKRGLIARPVSIRTDAGAERVLFWDTEKPCPLATGVTAAFRTVDNTVVGCEVAV